MKLSAILVLAIFATTAAASAQTTSKDDVLPRIESFVRAQCRPGTVPRDVESWLPVLRWAANQTRQNNQFARDVSWTLVRYEWWSGQGVSSPLAKAAARFNLSSAVTRLRLVSRAATDPETLERFLLAQGYLKEMESLSPSTEGNDVEALRSRVRDEINRQISPASTSDANTWLQTTVGDAFRSADQALVTATLARGQALESLEQVYGMSLASVSGGEASGDAQLMASLSAEDKQGFFESNASKKARDWLQQTKKSGPSPSSRPDTVIGDYTKLRQALEMGPADLLSTQRIGAVDSGLAPALTERVFHVNKRDRQVRTLLTELAPASRSPRAGATSSGLSVSTNLDAALLDGCNRLADLAGSDADGAGGFTDFVPGTTGSPRLAQVIRRLFANGADRFRDVITP
jgi:hypothetical protein